MRSSEMISQPVQVSKASQLLSAILNDPTPQNAYKGSRGRVLVVGGSSAYSGAPALAALSALRTASDYVCVSTPLITAPIIKSISMDLVVRPFTNVQESIPSSFKAHATLIGPGLDLTEEWSRHLPEHLLATRFQNSKDQIRPPVVVDTAVMTDPPFVNFLLKAAGHYNPRDSLIHSEPSKVKLPVILTPNRPEFQRLVQTLESIEADTGLSTKGHSLLANAIDALASDNVTQATLSISSLLQCILLVKGQWDLIAFPGGICHNCHRGITRRCAGQGDVLAGVTVAMAARAFLYAQSQDTHSPQSSAEYLNLLAAAALGSSDIVRSAALLAAQQTHSHSTLIASDLIPFLGQSLEQMQSLWEGLSI